MPCDIEHGAEFVHVIAGGFVEPYVLVVFERLPGKTQVLRYPALCGDAEDGFIRQYFQAGVLEFHPDAAEKAQVALIGYHLRALAYPGEDWEGREFGETAVLEAGVALAAR